MTKKILGIELKDEDDMRKLVETIQKSLFGDREITDAEKISVLGFLGTYYSFAAGEIGLVGPEGFHIALVAGANFYPEIFKVEKDEFQKWFEKNISILEKKE